MTDRLLAATHKIYLVRNDIVHSIGNDGLLEKEFQEVNHHIGQEYTWGSTFLSKLDKVLFKLLVEELIKDQGR